MLSVSRHRELSGMTAMLLSLTSAAGLLALVYRFIKLHKLTTDILYGNYSLKIEDCSRGDSNGNQTGSSR